MFTKLSKGKIQIPFSQLCLNRIFCDGLYFQEYFISGLLCIYDSVFLIVYFLISGCFVSFLRWSNRRNQG